MLVSAKHTTETDKENKMKLFDGFEAVKFPEENLIFITNNGYLYYIYNPKYGTWQKYKNAGNDQITVSKYPDVSEIELKKALDGIYPEKETDFMRCCNPSQLNIWNFLNLLKEDYSNYMSDDEIYDSVSRFLSESNIHFKSYLKLKELFDNAINLKQDKKQVLILIKEICFEVLGRDIFKKEIGIVDGHDCSSYFWIQPVRVIDYSDTNDIDNVAEMKSAEISIEENDVDQYLTPFLYKYYDAELEANKKRVDYHSGDDDEQTSYISGFEWYLTHNFYTYDAIKNMLKDISDTIDALSSGRGNEFTAKLKEKRGFATYELIYAKNLTDEQIKEYNANRPKEDDTEIELIIDFYNRFIYRIEYMMRVGKEKGYNLISFMGP